MGKSYDKEFKLQTIRMILEEGKPVAQVAGNWESTTIPCTAGWQGTSRADSKLFQAVEN